MSAVSPVTPPTPRTPATFRVPPTQSGDQGLSVAERPHAERIITRLFEAPDVDMVTFYDEAHGQYELRSRTGSVRWERRRDAAGALTYVITARTGADPIASLDPTALRTIEQEQAAAGGPGRPVPRDRSSFPSIYARLAQLFDHTRAPDVAIIPTAGGDSHYRGGGSHGVPDIVQSRAPLVMAGPGIARGAATDVLARLEDIAPTVADLLGVHRIDGTDASGVRRPQFLRWQDGHSLAGVAGPDAVAGASASARSTAERAIIVTVDGLSQTALLDEVAAGTLPNFARLMRMGTTYRNGAIAQYPTVTWPNHHTIVTGASPGHSGIVNNSWYDRAARREHVIVGGAASGVIRTGRFIDPQVETLYEAVARSFPGARTLALNQPAGRGASVSTLDLVGLDSIASRIASVGANFVRDWARRDRGVDTDVKWRLTALQDSAAAALLANYYAHRTPPKLTVAEFSQVDTQGHAYGPHSPQARLALRAVDRHLGELFGALDARGLTDSTAIVLTADHGMEPQAEHSDEPGGWDDALKRAAGDGARAIESSRFVYVRSVRVAVADAGAGRLAVEVRDDDADASGRRPGVAGATVVLRDAAGTERRARTDAAGRAVVDRTGMIGAVELVTEHADYSREVVALPTGGSK